VFKLDILAFSKDAENFNKMRISEAAYFVKKADSFKPAFCNFHVVRRKF